MNVLLDSHDLMDLLERSDPCTAEEFERILAQRGWNLITCPIVVKELAGPLGQECTKAKVWGMLSWLERLAKGYLSDAAIILEELEFAARSFADGGEPRVPPGKLLFERFDHAIPLRGGTSTELYLSYSLPEIVWDLWCASPNLFRPLSDAGESFQKALQARRASGRRPKKREFVAFVMGLADLYNSKLNAHGHSLKMTIDDADAFTAWLWERPDRCPGLRLSFEVRHQLMLNRGDQGQASDLLDLSLTQTVPYVDAVTVDKRTGSYLTRALRGLPTLTCGRVYHSTEELLKNFAPSAPNTVDGASQLARSAR